MWSAALACFASRLFGKDHTQNVQACLLVSLPHGVLCCEPVEIQRGLIISYSLLLEHLWNVGHFVPDYTARSVIFDAIRHLLIRGFREDVGPDSASYNPQAPLPLFGHVTRFHPFLAQLLPKGPEVKAEVATVDLSRQSQVLPGRQ